MKDVQILLPGIIHSKRGKCFDLEILTTTSPDSTLDPRAKTPKIVDSTPSSLQVLHERVQIELFLVLLLVP
jgi:hypothetical protein